MSNYKKISFVLAVLAMSLAVGYLAFAWTDAPAGTPPVCPAGHPGCDRPINVSAIAQTKAGALTINADFTANRLLDSANPAWFIDPAHTGIAGVFAGNVGIGTAAPGVRLDVFTTAVNEGGIASRDDGGARIFTVPELGSGGFNPMSQPGDIGLIYHGSGGANTGGLVIGQWSGAARGIRIDPAGNVGIGTTAPATRLEVRGGHPDTQLRLFSHNAPNPSAILNMWASEPHHTWDGVGIANNITNSLNFPRVDTTRGGSYIRLLNDGIGMNVVTSAGVDTRAITIISAGNVGIGTAAPANRLDVHGDIAIMGRHAFRGTDSWLRLNQDGAFTSGVHTPGVLAPMSLNVGGAGGWGNPGAGNAWITGNVGIGTTAPGARLEIFGTPGTQRITTIPSGTTGTYTLSWDAFQICQFGTCCPPWRDCDGDGRTYGARNDCDEGCFNCFVGSASCPTVADGRDQDCDGVVDEVETIYGCEQVVLNSATNVSCATMCANLGLGFCWAVGTDPHARNATIWDVDAIRDCRLRTDGTCASVMWAGPGMCFGHTGDWTNCLCTFDRPNAVR